MESGWRHLVLVRDFKHIIGSRDCLESGWRHSVMVCDYKHTHANVWKMFFVLFLVTTLMKIPCNKVKNNNHG